MIEVNRRMPPHARYPPVFRMMARRVTVAALLLLGLFGTASPSAAQPSMLGDGDCFKEIASLEYGEWSGSLDNNRFSYAFHHVEAYPYYRRVRGAFVGIETREDSLDGWEPGHRIGGRQGVGAEGHYALLHDLRGRATLRGVTVEVTSAADFAYFLYDRDKDARSFYYAHVAPRGLLDVMTTTENGAEFIETHGLWPWNPRFYWKARNTPQREWTTDRLEEKRFRTLFFHDRVVTIGGVEHTARKICRLEFSPLVVTNSAALAPTIEAELLRRAAKISAGRIATGTDSAGLAERRAAFRNLAPDSYVRVIALPSDHVGDFRGRSDLFGDVALTFTRDPNSDQIYYVREKKFVYYVNRETGYSFFYVRGHLSVGGRDLGVPVNGSLGRYYRCCTEDTRALKFQTFEMRWNESSEGDLRVECGSGECVIFAKKKKLRLR